MEKPRKQSRTHINLKNLPPLDPSTTSSYSQDKKIISVARYVPKAAKPGPQEEGTEAGKLFDHEANTEADLLADTNLLNNKHNTRDDEDDVSNCCVKHIIDSNNTIFKAQTQTKVDPKTSGDNKAFYNDSGEPNNISAKSQLHEICVANSWNPPLFECCKEEGPCHQRLFTFKVTVEIEGAGAASSLECYGAPRAKKKTAAEHAAEGALWYLKHLCNYFPIKKLEKRKMNTS